ncbi:hypothetical protein BG005_002377 [Podila minutissima]|nr:hypothetical protein BG005_002377 [Podila minutissima]
MDTSKKPPFPAMTASIFDIPHIVEAITLPLSFADLSNCILVNRQWHSKLIPYLWTDVINFRCELHEKYEYLFLDPIGRASLAKHARHIQALTCQDSELLPILVESGCTNLVELNYVIPEAGPGYTDGIYQRRQVLDLPSLGLDHLTKLIAANPGLQSVSIENVPMLPGGPSKISKEIWTFVAFLSQSCPSVTCFYLAGECLSQNNITKMLQTMLGHRLATLHPHDITTLHIKSPRSISRSKRGPPLTLSRTTGKRMYAWPARYAGMIPSWGASGRWENPRGKPYAPPECFAMLANPRSGVLEVTIPPQIMQSGIKAVLAQCPEIVSLHVDVLEESRLQGMLLGALHGSISAKVRELRVDVASLDLDALNLLLHGQDTRSVARISVREVALSLVAIRRNRDTWVPPMPAFLCQQSFAGQARPRRKDLGAAIVDLELAQRDLALGDMLQILGHCGNLERFRTKRVIIDDRTPLVSPLWVCSGSLRELSVWFVLDGLEMVNGRPQTEKYERSVQAANKIAPSVMEQVGGMVALRELGLHVNHLGNVGSSPFLQLAVEPLNGLGMLARLGELEKFEVSGLLHSVGHAELVWMKAHWPRLMSLSVPNFRSTGNASRQDVDVKELDQDYWKWLESLKVKKGHEWSYGDLVWSAPN